MRMKQMKSVMAALLLGFAATGTAKDQDGKPADKGSRNITTESGTEIIIRSESEKRYRDEDNSNRQPEPDATRGLERAEERRAEQADAHSQAGRKPSQDSENPWYDPFGWLPPSQDEDDEDSWWWPFD